MAPPQPGGAPVSGKRNVTELHRHPARFWEPIDDDGAGCRLCPQGCAIAPSRSGACGVRTNRNGTLYVDNYGLLTGAEQLSADQLPLFHFKPSNTWTRLSSRGCTKRCPFCNTHRYSLSGAARAYRQSPEQVVAEAIASGSHGISFGVNEPAPMHEFVAEVFAVARGEGLDTHLATSGMWSTEALREILPITSAVTLGLKGTDTAFHEETLGAHRDEILANINMMLTLGTHLEITWLVIPGITDHAHQASTLIDLISQYDWQPPIILIPYAPDFTWKEPRAARLEDLSRFHREALSSYSGYVYELHPESTALNTCCWSCNRPLVRRGLAGLIMTCDPGGNPREQCPTCGTPVPYVTA